MLFAFKRGHGNYNFQRREQMMMAVQAAPFQGYGSSTESDLETLNRSSPASLAQTQIPYPSAASLTRGYGSSADAYTPQQQQQQAYRESQFTYNSARESQFSSLSTATDPFQYSNYESRQSMASTTGSLAGMNLDNAKQPCPEMPKMPIHETTYGNGPQIFQAQAIKSIASPSPVPHSPASPGRARSVSIGQHTSRNFSRPFNDLQQQQPLPSSTSASPAMPGSESSPQPKLTPKVSLNNLRNVNASNQNSPSSFFTASPTMHAGQFSPAAVTPPVTETVILERSRHSPALPASHFVQSTSSDYNNQNNNNNRSRARSQSQGASTSQRPRFSPSNSNDQSVPQVSTTTTTSTAASSVNGDSRQQQPRRPNKLKKNPSRASLKQSTSSTPVTPRDKQPPPPPSLSTATSSHSVYQGIHQTPKSPGESDMGFNSSAQSETSSMYSGKRASRWRKVLSFGSYKRKSGDSQTTSPHWREQQIHPTSSQQQHQQPPEIVFSPPAAVSEQIDTERQWQMMQKRHEDAERAERQKQQQAYQALDQQLRQSLSSSTRPKSQFDNAEEYTEQLSANAGQSPSFRQGHEKRASDNSVYSEAYSFYDLGADDASSRDSHSMHSPMASTSSHGGHYPFPISSASSANAHYPPQASPYSEDGHAPPIQSMTTMAKTKASMAQLRPPARSNTKSKRIGGAGAADEKPLSEDEPMDCLLLGIEAHEKDELTRAAVLFEKSARLKGGVGAGMLLWGLSLLHGWGVGQDQIKGFKWLQRAAESVVDDLDAAVKKGALNGTAEDIQAQAAKSELVLSIYELGMCMKKGWGTQKDKTLALQYFELAANLGDPDAQLELGFCYLHGKGTKRDKKKAAKYYRMASKQGADTYGMHWIHKSKYDD